MKEIWEWGGGIFMIHVIRKYLKFHGTPSYITMAQEFAICP